MNESGATKTTIDSEFRTVGLDWADGDEVDDFPRFHYARDLDGADHSEGACEGSDADRGRDALVTALLGGCASADEQSLATQFEILLESLESFMLMCCDAGAVVEDELRGLALQAGPKADDMSDYLEMWSDPDELMGHELRGLAFVQEVE